VKKTIDFLIIGLGLAGGLLAWELIRRGRKVVVIDDGALSASQVAAGLINPLTGQRFVKTEDVDYLLPVAKDFYAALSCAFGRPFLIEKPMRRLLRSEIEAAHCRKRRQDGAYLPYLGEIRLSASDGEYLGYLEQKQTGYVMTRPLLAHLLEFLRVRDSYRQTALDYHEIRLDDEPSWRDLRLRQIIFCEGFRMRENPWFSWLPIQPVKGEILTLSHRLAIPDRILNDGHWLVPVDQDGVRIGATFDRENINTQITVAAKIELTTAAAQFFPRLRDAKLIAHEAGVRPCTADRRPFIGKHPHFPYLNIFNGFGAKGSLFIPWYCRRFADYLLNGEALPKLCDIKRYERTHFSG
jgi:glycine/D-amino acid oxidase-like deaminating enzyme